jgi:hypothetical protein
MAGCQLSISVISTCPAICRAEVKNFLSTCQKLNGRNPGSSSLGWQSVCLMPPCSPKNQREIPQAKITTSSKVKPFASPDHAQISLSQKRRLAGKYCLIFKSGKTSLVEPKQRFYTPCPKS